jgi:hypothetical protein
MKASFPVLQVMMRTLSQRMGPMSANAMITAAIPTGKDDLQQAQANRTSMMQGLLSETGNAWRQYPQTLGPLHASYAATGGPPAAPKAPTPAATQAGTVSRSQLQQWMSTENKTLEQAMQHARTLNLRVVD